MNLVNCHRNSRNSMRIGSLLVTQVLLVSCMPSVSEFRAHCLEIAEIKVLDQEKWKEYLDIALTPDGKLKSRPFKKTYESGEYEVFGSTPVDDNECKVKIVKDRQKPICEDGVFYRQTYKVVVSRNIEDANGKDVRISRKDIALVRSDFYTQQRLYPQKYSCWSGFREEYLVKFRRETLVSDGPKDESAFKALRQSETTGRPIDSKDWIKKLERRTGKRLAQQKRGPKSGEAACI